MLDAATGVLGGTPQALVASTAFVVTAANDGGTTTAELTLVVVDVPPRDLSYEVPARLVKGAVIEHAPTVAGGPVTQFRVEPALPSNLALDAATGLLSGTPDALVEERDYTVVALNSGGETATTLRFAVVDVAPSAPAYELGPRLTIGASIGTVFPAVEGGDVVSWTVAPPLPAGLSLDPLTGAVSGAPTALTTEATYTITASNTGGTASTELVLAVVDVAPNGLSYALPPLLTAGVSLDAVVPSVAGGAVTSWSIAPEFPEGLSFDPTTGAIGGVPASPNPRETYTVTASNTGGATEVDLVLGVVDPARIGSFDASPGTIGVGGESTLTWTVQGAEHLRLEPGGDVTGQSERSVAPSTTTTFVLVAVNAAGHEASVARTVYVDPTPFAISSFSSASASVPFGTSVNLSWTVAGLPTALALDGASVLGTTSAARVPVRRQTFRLEGENGAGSDARTVTVAARGLDLLAGNPGDPLARTNAKTQAGSQFAGLAVDAFGTVYLSLGRHIGRFRPNIRPDNIGSTTTSGSEDGPQNVALFSTVEGLAADAWGNVYAVDKSAHVLRRIAPDASVSTVAGRAFVAGPADGQGGAARFNAPVAVAVAPDGTIFVADATAVRAVNPGTSVVRTVAGPSTTLAGISGLAATASGEVFVAQSDHAIRRISLTGEVTVHAGAPGAAGSADGTRLSARFNRPGGLWSDADGGLVVADLGNATVRRIAPDGAVTTIAGAPQQFGYVDGTRQEARFDAPSVVARGPSGHLFVGDTKTNESVRRIDAAGNVATLATLLLTSGGVNGVGPYAAFAQPEGLAVAADGTLLVAERGVDRIRGVTPGGETSEVAGRLTGDGDGTGTAASFRRPAGLAVFGTTAYVADTGNHLIRAIAPGGVVTTLAGSPRTAGEVDGTGTAARFNSPGSLATDAAGNVYVADWGNRRVRRVTPAGAVTTLDGDYPPMQYVGGEFGVAVTPDGGTLYVSSTLYRTIYRMRLSGSTYASQELFAGSPFAGPGFVNGPGSLARFRSPGAMVLDPQGNLFVVDAANQAVRKITPAGLVSTVVGQPTRLGVTAGTFADAGLYFPVGLARTADGDLLVSTANAIVQLTAP